MKILDLKTVEKNLFDAGFRNILSCPGCGEEYLHHRTIKVFERSEDSKTGIHVVIKGENVAVDTDLAGNPSSRRNGLLIEFDCEHCLAKPVLSIEQHKGSTYVEFVARLADLR